MVTWVKVANELREKLPTEVQETLLKHEKDETTERYVVIPRARAELGSRNIL